MTTTLGLWIHLQAALLLLFSLALGGVLRTVGKRALLLLGAVALLLPFAPLGALDLGGYLYAFSGQLSITSLILMASSVQKPWSGKSFLAFGELRLLLAGFGAFALGFYPLALGVGPIDPYGWGFGQAFAPLTILLIAAFAWRGGRRGLALIFCAAVWGWLLQIGESNNLWDYLIDIWLALYAVAWGSRQMLGAGRRLLTRSTKADS